MLEASDESMLQELDALALNLTSQIYHFDSRQRSYFHLAAVMCNNFVNHLFTQAFDILEKKQLPTELLHVLMKETVDKAIAMQPSQAQTGPAFRGDSKSIEKHLQLLQGEPYMQKIYQDLTDSIIAFYKKK